MGSSWSQSHFITDYSGLSSTFGPARCNPSILLLLNDKEKKSSEARWGPEAFTSSMAFQWWQHPLLKRWGVSTPARLSLDKPLC